CLQRSNWPTF
nr:immunoglobulin light chain junction region [Macaca mulatta]